MNSKRRLLVLSPMAFLTMSCGGGSTSSGFGSKNICFGCTEVAITNRTHRTIEVDIKGKTRTIAPAMSLTVEYLADEAKNVAFNAYLIDGAGRRILPGAGISTRRRSDELMPFNILLDESGEISIEKEGR